MSNLQLDDWFESQMLRQEGEMDCGVCVFGALAKLTRNEILRDIPEAVNGLTVDRWTHYLTAKGNLVMRYDQDGDYPLPCAHLVGHPPHCHWIYQAEDGGIHDPSPAFQYVPPKLLGLCHYGGTRILTLAIASRSSDSGIHT